MNIGIDIDGVLTNDDEYLMDCISKYCFENNLDSFTDPYAYEFNKLNWDKDIIDDYRSKYFDEYIDNEPARKFASEVTKKLKSDGHHIYIITARHDCKKPEMKRRIENWLNKNNISYDKLICANVPKIKEIQENNIDIMIEDSPSTIPQINDIVKVFCYDTRYNKELKLNNVTRVFSWYDIYSKINLLKNSIV